MEDLKKIFIIAIAVAIGIVLFKVVFTIVGVVFAILLDVAIVGLMIFGGVYLYKKYFEKGEDNLPN